LGEPQFRVWCFLESKMWLTPGEGHSIFNADLVICCPVHTYGKKVTVLCNQIVDQASIYRFQSSCNINP
jgi:hypothetical protein